MSTKTLNTFFSGKKLTVPNYQRDYAWTKENVDDLFDDIEEALSADGSHYLGTFILSRGETNGEFNVVDGQQRLTTLTMLLDALTHALESKEIQAFYRNQYIENPLEGFKFRVLGENDKFFQSLLNNDPIEAKSDGQERLAKNYNWIRTRAHSLSAKGQETILAWLQCLSKLEVLEFIEPNEGKAIRMFQSVNDRGVPLAKMDIAKSLLVYYSNRYLDGELDNHIAQKFGQAFRCFSQIKKLGSEKGFAIKNVSRDTFREDDILRYHHLAFHTDVDGVIFGDDYSATTEAVLSRFLKPTLHRLRNAQDALRRFLKEYTDDLTSFFSALEETIRETRIDRSAYLFWVAQDPSTVLYPLMIRLKLLGMADQTGENDSRSLKELIELTDMRVYKIRGTTPQRDIFDITRMVSRRELDASGVARKLLDFCQSYMPDNTMQSRLVDSDAYRQSWTTRVLLHVEDEARLAMKKTPLMIEELKKLNTEGWTVEHILPQDPDNSFSVSPYGFETHEDYAAFMHRLGNLILLEESINKACQNRPVHAKVSESNLYPKSGLQAVLDFSATYSPGTTIFNKEELSTRAEALTPIIMNRWRLN